MTSRSTHHKKKKRMCVLMHKTNILLFCVIFTQFDFLCNRFPDVQNIRDGQHSSHKTYVMGSAHCTNFTNTTTTTQ